MVEIIDFAKAKALRETQKDPPRKKVSLYPYMELTTPKRETNPNTEIGKLLYEMGLEMGEFGAKQLGAELLTKSLGMHRAGIVIENLEIVHKFKEKQGKSPVRILDE